MECENIISSLILRSSARSNELSVVVVSSCSMDVSAVSLEVSHLSTSGVLGISGMAGGSAGGGGCMGRQKEKN